MTTRCCQFKGQRHALQPETDRGDGACVLLSQLEPGQHSLRPLHKERHRGNVRQDFASWQVVQVGHLQRRDRECIFPPDVQQRTAGHQELELRT